MNKKFLLAGALLSVVLAYLSYRHLAIEMFRMGSKRLVEITNVPEQCNDAVAYAAAAFAGIYDYVSYVAVAAFLLLAAFLAWSALFRRHEIIETDK